MNIKLMVIKLMNKYWKRGNLFMRLLWLSSRTMNAHYSTINEGNVVKIVNQYFFIIQLYGFDNIQNIKYAEFQASSFKFQKWHV